MIKYTRKTINAPLKKYWRFAKKKDGIQLTEWENGNGVDVEIQGKENRSFDLSYAELEAINDLAREFGKDGW